MDIEVFIAFKTLLLTLSIVEQEAFLNDEEPWRQRREIHSSEMELWLTAQEDLHLTKAAFRAGEFTTPTLN